MTQAILNQSLFLISVLMVALGIVIPLVGNWISNRRNYQGKASMEDIYDRWSYSNQQETAAANRDLDHEWLGEHEKTCPGGAGVLIRSKDEAREWTHLDIQKCCNECVSTWQSLYDAEPVVMPDFNPLDEIKATFAKITTLHPERAA